MRVEEYEGASHGSVDGPRQCARPVGPQAVARHSKATHAIVHVRVSIGSHPLEDDEPVDSGACQRDKDVRQSTDSTHVHQRLGTPSLRTLAQRIMCTPLPTSC